MDVRKQYIDHTTPSDTRGIGFMLVYFMEAKYVSCMMTYLRYIGTLPATPPSLYHPNHSTIPAIPIDHCTLPWSFPSLPQTDQKSLQNFNLLSTPHLVFLLSTFLPHVVFCLLSSMFLPSDILLCCFKSQHFPFNPLHSYDLRSRIWYELTAAFLRLIKHLNFILVFIKHNLSILRTSLQEQFA